MPELIRMGLSIERPLLEQLDAMVESGGYTNRSEFIRDMIRDKMVKREWEQNKRVVGTITLVYDHHQRMLSDRLVEVQHHSHDLILASTHVHLDEDKCLEVIIARGPAAELQKIVDELRQQKGVLHAAVALSSTGSKLK